ncbi:MAG: VCBS repeat-containing protein [Oscillospiraceae bacterium]|nr:VCBS repeat-containing protein [Oscillospiraceae bacterium]
MRREKRLIAVLAALFMSLLLCGCEFGSNVEDLYALPKMPEEYTGLNQLLDELRAEGYEYIAPATGQYLQPVHMVDLDGDHKVEAVAFFRNANEEKPLKIFVYRAMGESYELLCSVESSGSSIDSVRYEDLNGDDHRELIVGWKMTADVQTLAVYNLRREALPLMSCSYSRYTIEDIDNNGLSDLFVLRGDGTATPAMEIYMWQTNILAVAHQCALSSTMTELGRGSIVNGTTLEGRSAIFVTGVTEENRAITDVLVWQESIFNSGNVVNAVVDEDTGRSELVQPYRQLRPGDINGDGFTEIPAPENTTQSDTLVYWHQCSALGYSHVVSKTYHSQSNGWFFVLPRLWWDRVTVSAQETMAGENQVLMSVDGCPIIAIYTLTGENREVRASVGERFLIRRQTGVVYAAELLEGAEIYGMDPAQLRSSFNMIVEEWLPNGGW